jgi:hypothetical protein
MERCSKQAFFDENSSPGNGCKDTKFRPVLNGFSVALFDVKKARQPWG